MIAGNSTVTPDQYQGLFRDFAGALRDHLDLTGQVDEAKARQIAQETIDAARLPRPLAVSINDGPAVKLEDRTHCQFEQLLGLVSEGHRNLLMVGPAGSGKTTLAKDVAKALGLDFGFISLSAGVTETHLFGRMLPQADGTWGYVESVFVRIYRNGGVFLLDELDAADANVMVSINAALANGCLCNPVTGEVVARHERCYIIAAANTWGRDADHLINLVYDPAKIDPKVLEAELAAAREQPEAIPDYAFDCHTAKGKRAGKTRRDVPVRFVSASRRMVLTWAGTHRSIDKSYGDMILIVGFLPGCRKE